MKRKSHKATPLKSQALLSVEPVKQQFIDHFYELRRRLFFVVLSIGIWSAAAYTIEHHIIRLLLAPSHGQSFIYTSPIGGMNFLFRVCIYVGIVASFPVIVYQFLRYLEPLLKRSSMRFIWLGTTASGVLAIAGIVFGYFIGLPTALNFLLHQFITSQIKPLLTIEAYLSFVTIYMVGAALMFQVPLIILFINRIKPLTPQQLLGGERWVILAAFLLAFIMNPTPNIISQLFVAGPIILSYQLSIGLIWWSNRTYNGKKFDALRATDEQVQAERLERAQDLETYWQAASLVADHPMSPLEAAEDISVPTPSPASSVRRPVHPAAYTRRPATALPPRSHSSHGRPISDFVRRPKTP